MRAHSKSIFPPITEDELRALMKPYDSELAIWPVDRRVNNARNKSSGLANPFEQAPNLLWDQHDLATGISSTIPRA